MSLQEALKRLRLELGWTQADLAQKLNKAYVTVSRWENGKGFPSRANARQILALAGEHGASAECAAYLEEVLRPGAKRVLPAAGYGFPEIDREFLFQLADGSATAIYVIEAGTYRVLYANRAAEKAAQENLAACGVPEGARRMEEREDRRCFHLFANGTGPCSFCPLAEMGGDRFANKVVSVPGTGKTYQIHAKLDRMKGRDVYAVYLTDISGSRAERSALYEMTNDIPAGVGIYDVRRDGSIELVFMNTRLFRMIGEERQTAMLGSRSSGVCLAHPEDLPRLMAEVWTALRQKRDAALEMRMRFRDGRYHPVRLDAKMIGQDGEKVTFYCLFREQPASVPKEPGPPPGGEEPSHGPKN